MTFFDIKIKDTPVTVDLSKFVGLNQDSINWGDGNTTNNTFSHTYNSDGKYSIIANFEDVTEIEDNFTINNLLSINFSHFSSLSILGSNFLNNCSDLKYFNFIDNDIYDIKSNFLNGCSNLEVLKLPKYVPDLESWGENISTNVAKLKIFVDHKSNYQDDYIWNDNTIINKEWKIIEYIYKDNITLDYVTSRYLGNNIFINDFINLNECTNIKEAIDNNDIYVEDNIEYEIDADRRLFKDEEKLKKTIFIIEYKYKFDENPNSIGSESYYLSYDRIVKAKRTFVRNGVNFLELEDYNDDTYFYLDGKYDEIEDIKKYTIKDVLTDNMAPSVIRHDVAIRPYNEYEDPPYFRGWIRFGEINNENYTNVPYNGDVNTGFNIEIKAKGKCKDLRIWDVDVNEKLGRREFIRINTDNFPGGSIMSGDYILIKTSLGEKSAILERDGEKIDIMKYIDRSSSWLQIYKGDNMFFATASTNEDDGSIYNVKINLIWNELYEGI